MRLFLLLGFLISSVCGANSSDLWRASWRSFEELSLLLKSTPSGRAIWAEAEAIDPAILNSLKKGKVSLTESTYARSYSVSEGREVVNIQHEVSIAEGSSRADAVLDLAHELVHYSRRTLLSPYDPSLRRDQFIRVGIEGAGGEIDAFSMECRVAKEMLERFPEFPTQKLCARYWTASGEFDSKKVHQDFYAVGRHYQSVRSALGRGGVLPDLNNGKVVFRSSYAGVAYPVALSKEFDETIATACRNNARKARVLASIDLKPVPGAVEEQKRLEVYRRVQCGSSILK